MRKNRFLFVVLLSLSLLSPNYLYSAPKAKDMQPLCDSLRLALKDRMGVDMELTMNRVTVSGNKINLFFSPILSYYPWRKGDPQWFVSEVKKYLPSVAKGYNLGYISTNNQTISELVVPELTNDGKAISYSRKTADPHIGEKPLVSRIGTKRYDKGLSDRYIALWQSHGRYYNEGRKQWEWQRPALHRTVEDMFTQSFVLPFLMPMLENSGAYVLSPRERDIQPREIIVDNDPSFEGERKGLMRQKGVYSEDGKWTAVEEGFADFKQAYTFEDYPFIAGTARIAQCAKKINSTAQWTAPIEQRGEYAVYISYKSLPKSSTGAHYTVKHKAGVSEFEVNQNMGGGTWIYLGTFEFDKEAIVLLDNRGEKGTVVCADAVKIGGGIGKLEREGKTSGMASAFEGAHYWMNWAGADTTITRHSDTDYTNDLASRGLWTVMMKEQKNIPIDLSLAFHSDAMTTPNDSTIGTLGIYTLLEDGVRKFSDGRDRILSRLFCDFVQTQVVQDIQAEFDPLWTRRGTWDKGYSECRTTGVPAMILELLSHQNLADMKHGLDPAFHFTVSRAVYKGILKTLSAFYGCDYVVQPLPVKSFATNFVDENMVHLQWQAVIDTLEATAYPEGYILYTRIDDGAFDQGVEISEPFAYIEIEKGHIYSFKIEAFNKGGKSFPSEILSVGVPENDIGSKSVIIVNNFDRISAPAWVDTPQWAGFDGKKDSGVPYIRDISYVGENYEFDRSIEYVDDFYPGFGASFDEFAGQIVAGNSFDYPYVHGRSLFELGYSFYSMSKDAFCSLPKGYSDLEGQVLDLICGKQGRTQIGRGAVEDKFEVFSDTLITALKNFASRGGNILLSGSNIASDCDEQTAISCSELFAYRLAAPQGTATSYIEDMEYSHSPNPYIYSVESPDGLLPKAKTAGIWLRYPRSTFGAAIYYKAQNYKSISIAVPIESIVDEENRLKIFSSAMDYFTNSNKAPAKLSR